MVIRSTDLNQSNLDRIQTRNDIHLSTGHEDEIPCECKRMLCGFVYYTAIHSTCPYHGSRWNNTVTEWHYAKDCHGFEIDYSLGEEND